MLARTYGPKLNSFPCYVQPKLNGVRALYQNGVFQSRDEKVWNPNVLAHLTRELNTIAEINSLASTPILDGELYVHGWRLQDINAAVAVNRSKPTEKTAEVEFHVFDVVDPGKNFLERTFAIEIAIRTANLPHIKFVPTYAVATQAALKEWFNEFVSKGYEGIMLRPDGPYEFGERQGTRVPHPTTYRSKYLWKYKQFEDGEYVCVGVTRGTGKADIGIGALVLAKPEDVFCAHSYLENPISQFNCGTGYTDAERIFYAGNPPIGKLVKVRYPYLSSDGVPQCPSFLAVL